MNTQILTSDVRKYVAEHLVTVFDTMLSFQAVVVTEDAVTPFTGAHVSGSVGIVGAAVSSQLYFHITAPFAIEAAAAMLSLPPAEITNESEVNDLVGELANMLGGGLKSWLCDAGVTCVLTTPAVIRGTAFTVSAKPGIEVLQLGFDCNGRRGLVAVHLKFN
jgi:CheY-specific phosphatase CheX